MDLLRFSVRIPASTVVMALEAAAVVAVVAVMGSAGEDLVVTIVGVDEVA